MRVDCGTKEVSVEVITVVPIADKVVGVGTSAVRVVVVIWGDEEL